MQQPEVDALPAISTQPVVDALPVAVAQSEQPRHSRVYELIINSLEDPSDPVGLFAYAVYKREKMKEIDRLTKALGRRPHNGELQQFVDSAENRIENFIRIAEIELGEFQGSLVGEHIQELNERYAEQFFEEIKRFKPQKPVSWFKSALYGLAGNIFTIILTFTLFLLGVLALEGSPALAGFFMRILQRWAGQ